MTAGTLSRHRAPRRPAGGRIGDAAPYLLLAPSVVLMAVLLGYPLVRLLDISFQRFTREQLFTRQTVYNGVDNYVKALTDPEILAVMVRSVTVVAAMVVGTVVLGTAIALLLERLGKVMRTVVSIGLLFAWATPTTSAVVVWKWMFNSRYGVATWLLSLVGVDWHGDNSVLFSPVKVLSVVTLIVVWQGIPFVTLTLYAGLTQVPRELYEAAEMDGAGFWLNFRLVTVPMLKPIFMLLITLSVIWDFRAFNQVWVFNRGGPNNETLLLGSYSYFASFVQFDFGLGAAVAVIMVVGLFALTAYYVRQMVRSGEAS
jgi:N,N'-diacetylchitobiose transport system permease protein